MVDATGLMQLGRGSLFIGSAPDGRTDVFDRFDYVVFSAQELQPATITPRDAMSSVIRCPLADADPPRPGDLNLARACARKVAILVQRGKRVLVTCAQGRNRSGLICGLVIRYLLPGVDGGGIVDHIRALRPYALTNLAYAKEVAGRAGGHRVRRG